MFYLFLVALTLSIPHPCQAQLMTTYRNRMASYIVKIRDSKLLGPGVTLESFYDQFDDFNFGIVRMPKPIARHLALLELPRSVHHLRRASDFALNEIRQILAREFIPA